MISRLGKRIHKEIAALHKETQGVGIKIYIPGVSSSSSHGEGTEDGGSGAGGSGAGGSGAGGSGPGTIDLSIPWRAYVKGPEGTPYEGCVYAVNITIPSDYPHKPPDIMFTNQCWHPNIGVNGHVCVDILQREWSPTLSVIKILQSVQSMLDDPDPTSPLNASAGDMFNRSRRDRAKLEEYTHKIRASVGVGYKLSESEKEFDASKSVLM